MKRAALPAALAAVLLLPAAAAAAPPRLSANVTPRAVLFGDRVVARLDVLLDTRAFEPRPVSVSTPTGAWSELGAPATSTAAGGRWARTRIELTLVCAQVACTAEGRSAAAPLPAATVTVRRRDGAAVRLTARWPQVIVASRLAAGASAASSPPFRLDTAPPPVRTSVPANGVAWLLDAMSLALLLAAAVLVVDVLRRRRVPRPVDPYARALALAREAEHRPPADRRRALALLGRLAGDRETAAAAWSAPDPTPERLAAIVDRLERNGDGA